MAFFLLQAPLLLAETTLRRRARAAGISLHPFIARLGVLLVLGIAADAFFWPVVTQPLLVARLALSGRVLLRDLRVVCEGAGGAGGEWCQGAVGALEGGVAAVAGR